MIATISAEERNIWESISTCRFSQRVACVSNLARYVIFKKDFFHFQEFHQLNLYSRNEELDDKVVIRKLKQKIAELEAEIHEIRSMKKQEVMGSILPVLHPEREREGERKREGERGRGRERGRGERKGGRGRGREGGREGERGREREGEGGGERKRVRWEGGKEREGGGERTHHNIVYRLTTLKQTSRDHLLTTILCPRTIKDSVIRSSTSSSMVKLTAQFKQVCCVKITLFLEVILYGVYCPCCLSDN